MAASQKVEEFDLKGLREFKKSLQCVCCKVTPRPGMRLFSSYIAKREEEENPNVICHVCAYDILHDDDYAKEYPGLFPLFDPTLTKFVSLIKLYDCVYLYNGCQEELEAKDLDAHEKICLLRGLTCPKFDCNKTTLFVKVLDHYQEKHPDFQMKDDVLEFKGSLEDLEKSTFILNCYGKPFFPQFIVEENVLHFWVVGHGNQDEINSFEVNYLFLSQFQKFSNFDFVIGHSKILD